MFAENVVESSAERNNTTSAPQGPNARNPRTCVTCKRRKVKCDRISPCGNCIKAQIPCKYPPPGRAPRQPRRGTRLPEKGNLPELVDQVWALMARTMEQSVNPETAALKQFHDNPFPSKPREGAAMGEQSKKPTAVRVVGMDESTGSRSEPGLRDTTLDSGPSKAQPGTQPAGRALGQLVLGEGKSQYIPSPFWASMSEVCISFLGPYSIAKIHNRALKKGYKKYLKNTTTKPRTRHLSCLPRSPPNIITTVS